MNVKAVPLFDLPRDDVRDMGDGVFLVASGTTKGVWYRVDHGRCECLGFQHRERCKHVRMLIEDGFIEPEPVPVMMQPWDVVTVEQAEAFAAVTARFSNKHVGHHRFVPVRTSIGQPRFPLPYALNEALPQVMPDRWMLNLDAASYLRAYRKKLETVGVDAILDAIVDIGRRNGGRTLVLLCYEDIRKGQEEYCHRRIMVDWLNEHTGEIIPELAEA